MFQMSFDQKLSQTAAFISMDAAAILRERALAGGEFTIARRNSLDLAEAIKAALKEDAPKSRWSKNQTLSEKLSRLPGSNRPASRKSREEMEDHLEGAYLNGTWTKFSK